MPRKLRVEYPGAMYHVMSTGDRREGIFLTDVDRQDFIRTLRRLGWRKNELSRRRKSDPAKLAIAARLRKETTLSLKHIAEQVHLGTSKSANARLHQWMKRENQTSSTQTRLSKTKKMNQAWVDPFKKKTGAKPFDVTSEDIPFSQTEEEAKQDPPKIEIH